MPTNTHADAVKTLLQHCFQWLLINTYLNKDLQHKVKPFPGQVIVLKGMEQHFSIVQTSQKSEQAHNQQHKTATIKSWKSMILEDALAKCLTALIYNPLQKSVETRQQVHVLLCVQYPQSGHLVAAALIFMMGLRGSTLLKLNDPISQSRREALAGLSPFCLEVLSESVQGLNQSCVTFILFVTVIEPINSRHLWCQHGAQTQTLPPLSGLHSLPSLFVMFMHF